MSGPEDCFNRIFDKFVESETMLIAIQTPDRDAIENLIRAAMHTENENEYGLKVTGVFFDAEPIRSSSVDKLSKIFMALDDLRNKDEIIMDRNSIQIA